jgi:uncharacterized protein (TIGR03437 family)
MSVLKSTDGGRTFSATGALPTNTSDTGGSVTSIALDPFNSQTVYAALTPPGGVFKTMDGGVTWSASNHNLPAGVYVDSITLDPFNPQSVWIWCGVNGYVSQDGGSTWTVVPMPSENGNSATGGFRYVFDHAKPGIVYGPSLPTANQTALGVEKSTDGGHTWTQLLVPFSAESTLVADPTRAGYLYALDPSLFYRSTDGGATWQSFPFPENSFSLVVAVDPRNPQILIAGAYRSTDDGRTWSPTNASRDIQPVFAPSAGGLVYATAPTTSDAFLAEFAPDGASLLFATYFGGMGNDSASGIRIDTSGNIWITGTTSSFDLPAASSGFQSTLKGSSNAFVAKFTPNGQPIAATYLGGSANDSAKALRLDSQGNIWITGQSTSPNFPLTTPPATPPTQDMQAVFVTELNATLGQELFSTLAANTFEEDPGGLTIDPNDNVIVTGTTYSSNFPLLGTVIHASGSSAATAFLVKFDYSGNKIFSTYLGGTGGYPGSFENIGVAVAAGSDGSIYLTGNTSATDFPVTPGAYKGQLKGTGCPYPTSAFETGIIGIIDEYQNEDVFIAKLSADGSTLIYSTLLGGSCYDRPTDLALTSSDQAVVTGETDSLDFPVTFPVEAAPLMLNYRSFVSMLDAQGANLLYSTYLSAGSSPTLAPLPAGVIHIGGDQGYLAQTSTFSGPAFFTDLAMTAGYLASLKIFGSAPSLDLADVLNDFSLLPGPVAPGEIIRLVLPDFAPAQSIDIGLNERQPLGTTLAGIQVLFDGQPVSVIAVRPGKIICVAPQSFSSTTTTSIQVKSGSTMVSNVLLAQVAPFAPGLLSADGSGTGAANARNADGQPNSPDHPAAPDSFVTLYFTGAGAPPQNVAINGQTVAVAPLQGFVPGIYAAYFQIPDQPQPSPLSVTLYPPGANVFLESQSLLVYFTPPLQN